jgi:hypothetical protein
MATDFPAVLTQPVQQLLAQLSVLQALGISQDLSESVSCKQLVLPLIVHDMSLQDRGKRPFTASPSMIRQQHTGIKFD